MSARSTGGVSVPFALLALTLSSVAAAQEAPSAAPDRSVAPAPSSAPAPSPTAGPARTASPVASSSPRRPSEAPARPSDPKSEDLDAARSTPRRAFTAFLRACERGDFTTAAESLDLRGRPRGREPREGPELAAMLYRVLGWRTSLDPASLPDEPSPAGAGAEGIVLDVVEVDGKSYPLALAPVRQSNGEIRWMFPRTTVAAIRTIYDANERLSVEERIPEWLKKRPVLGLMPWQWLGLLVSIAGAYGIGRGIGTLVAFLGHRLVKNLSRTLAEATKGLERPVRLALGVAAFSGAAPYLLLPLAWARTAEKTSTILYIFATAWAVIAIIRVLTASWERRLPDDTLGDLESRTVRTRLTMMRRIATVIVGLVAAGVALLQIEVVRSIGVSLLASAGIAGVLVGIAAQRTLGGIIAGIEMSITQPVRIGDVVVFRPGEVGTVERIYFTYVIVRLWDDRRLIVPVTRVMADAFENWTRTGADLLAPVELFVDYAAPLEALRESFEALCKANPKWDGRVCRVEVVDATDKALRVRGIASVDVATKAWDLRADLREGWIRALQELEGGRYLPLGRVISVTDPKAAEEKEAPETGAVNEGSPEKKAPARDQPA